MPTALTVSSELQAKLDGLDRRHDLYATRVVEHLLDEAIQQQASDLHITPTAHELLVSLRLAGVLHPLVSLPTIIAPNVAARLKVLAELLTYRTEVPQEGRLKYRDDAPEMRLSTFPTLFGENAAVRLFAPPQGLLWPEELGFPDDVIEQCQQVLAETGGVAVVAGPAGSGKTTTAYALLRALHRAAEGGRAIMSLEDPVESVLPGIIQAAVRPSAGLDYTTGLKSLLRQDPDVLLVGEIRDRETAEVVFQAGMTGHLVLTTFHAGTSTEALSRLRDLGIEPYLLRAALIGVFCQRLVRMVCKCASWSERADDLLGLNIKRTPVAVGCPECHGRGYRGRAVLIETLVTQLPQLATSILAGDDAVALRRRAIDLGMPPLLERATAAVESGKTTAAEVRRVLGFRI